MSDIRKISDGLIKELSVNDYILKLLMEDENIAYYGCESTDGLDTVTVTADPENPEIQCIGDIGTKKLKKGVNTLVVKAVKGEDVVKEYNISVVLKKMASDVGIAGVIVNGEDAVPVMKDGQLDHYYIKVSKEANKAFIEIITNDNQAEVTGDLDEQEIEGGLNSFVVKVTSSDEKKYKLYQIVVESEKEEEAQEKPEEVLEENLDEVAEENPDELPEGNPEEEPEENEEEVPYITAEIPDILVRQIQTEPGQPPVELTRILIMGVAFKSRINAEELEKNHIESSLLDDKFIQQSLSEDRTILSTVLRPEFAPTHHSYESFVGYEVEQVYIVAKANNPMYVISGHTGQQRLRTGQNRFVITVSDPKTERETSYSVLIERSGFVSEEEIEEIKDVIDGEMDQIFTEEQKESRLQEITVTGGIIEPEFTPDYYEYQIILDDEIASISLAAKAMSEGSGVEGDLGENEVVIGKNSFVIICTAENGVDKSVYKLFTTRKKEVPSDKEKESGKDQKKDQKKLPSKTGVQMTLFKGRLHRFFKGEKENRIQKRWSHKMIALFLLMVCTSYLVYSFYYEPVSTEHRKTLEEYDVSAEELRIVRERGERRSEMEETIAKIDEEIAAYMERYPSVPSQEEILDYIDALSQNLKVTYTMVTIDTPLRLTSADMLNNVTAKNLAGKVPDVAAITPPMSENAVTVAEGVQLFAKNNASFVFQGSYDELNRLYDKIHQDSRYIIVDFIRMTKHETESGYDETGAVIEGTVYWEMEITMHFYSYSGAEEQKTEN